MSARKNVLFVCTGNSCRSPMAEALFRRLVEGRGDYEVRSAGVSAGVGERISPETAQVLAKRGISSADFRSQPLSCDLIRDATHIFAMTNSHRETLERLFPEAADKSYLVCEFSEIDGEIGCEIPDPIGLGMAAYQETCEMLEIALPSVLAFIDQTTKANSDPIENKEMNAVVSSPDSEAPTSGGHQNARLVIAADHGGVEMKNALVEYLNGRGYGITDLGTDSTESVDYPDYAHQAATLIQQGRADFGILCCTTGIGMSIAANRHPGIRASVVFEPDEAAATRAHNSSNVLCLSGKKTDIETAKQIVDAYLSADFDGGRHERRVRKLDSVAVDPGALDPIVAAVDLEVAEALQGEYIRERDHLELIASENFTSAAVRAAQGSYLTNKYAEGYPGRRWYGGCEYVDVVEQLAIDRAKELFGGDHVNVQPHSGSQANAAVYFSVLKPGDKILTMDLSHGGHLTHGHPANFSGKFYEVVHYGVSQENERIDYDHLAKLAEECRPKMITAGASAYPRVIDFPRMAEIAKSVGAYLFVDMAHIAGLVAAGEHPSPIPHADFVTTTTHKSLRGPRGGLIFCREEFAKKIDSTVFPGVQGGPLMHVIAAKAVCLKEGLMPEFKTYQKQVVINASVLADALTAEGFRMVSGGTDNHVMMIDLRPNDLNGKLAQETLDLAGITVNKNSIPFDTLSPMKGGGIRLGTPAVTTRGMKEEEMKRIAHWIREALMNHGDSGVLESIRLSVKELNQRFPLP